jgi:hypothetical protein
MRLISYSSKELAKVDDLGRRTVCPCVELQCPFSDSAAPPHTGLEFGRIGGTIGEEGGRRRMTVAIVLDPLYPELQQLAKQMPTWEIDSVPHRVVAERLRQLPGTADAFQGITLFKVINESDAEDNCISIVGQVDLHHGIYSSRSRIATLRVIGTKPSNRVREALAAYGFMTLEPTPDGFVAHAQ